MAAFFMSLLGPEVYMLLTALIGMGVAWLYGNSSGKKKEQAKQLKKQLEERDIIDDKISDLRDIDHGNAPALDGEFVQNDPRNRHGKS